VAGDSAAVAGAAILAGRRPLVSEFIDSSDYPIVAGIAEAVGKTLTIPKKPESRSQNPEAIPVGFLTHSDFWLLTSGFLPKRNGSPGDMRGRSVVYFQIDEIRYRLRRSRRALRFLLPILRRRPGLGHSWSPFRIGSQIIRKTHIRPAAYGRFRPFGHETCSCPSNWPQSYRRLPND